MTDIKYFCTTGTTTTIKFTKSFHHKLFTNVTLLQKQSKTYMLMPMKKKDMYNFKINF